jgi:hypothetical protein
MNNAWTLCFLIGVGIKTIYKSEHFCGYASQKARIRIKCETENKNK